MTLQITVPDLGSVVADESNMPDAIYQAIHDLRINPAMRMEPDTWAWAWERQATIVELGDRQWDQVIQALRTTPGFEECLKDPERPRLWGRTLVHVPVPSWMMAW